MFLFQIPSCIVEHILRIEMERGHKTHTQKIDIPTHTQGGRLFTEEGKEKHSWSLLLDCSSNLHHYQSRKLLPHCVYVLDIYNMTCYNHVFSTEVLGNLFFQCLALDYSYTRYAKVLKMPFRCSVLLWESSFWAK